MSRNLTTIRILFIFLACLSALTECSTETASSFGENPPLHDIQAGMTGISYNSNSRVLTFQGVSVKNNGRGISNIDILFFLSTGEGAGNVKQDIFLDGISYSGTIYSNDSIDVPSDYTTFALPATFGADYYRPGVQVYLPDRLPDRKPADNAVWRSEKLFIGTIGNELGLPYFSRLSVVFPAGRTNPCVTLSGEARAFGTELEGVYFSIGSNAFQNCYMFDAGASNELWMTNLDSTWGNHTVLVFLRDQLGRTSITNSFNVRVYDDFRIRSDLADSADIPGASLRTGGYSGWEVDSNTYFTPPASIRSTPDMPEYTNNWLSINTFASNIAFRYKVSGANWGGYGDFYFDIDGTNRLDVNGETAWLITNFSPGAGNHTFQWKFQRGYYYTGVSNCAWVDGLRMNFDETKPVIQNFSLTNGMTVTNADWRLITRLKSSNALVRYVYSQDGTVYFTNLLTNTRKLETEVTNRLRLLAGTYTICQIVECELGFASPTNTATVVFNVDQTELSFAADLSGFPSDTGGHGGWEIDTNTYFTPPASIRSSPDMPQYTNNWFTVSAFVSNVAFRYKVSGANWGGDGDFYFDIDGTNRLDVNGETGWLMTNFRPGAGSHTFQWMYQRGYYYTGVSNCAWVDGIVMNFDETPPVVSNRGMGEGTVITNSIISVVSLIQSVHPLNTFYYSIDGQEYQTNWLTNGNVVQMQLTNTLYLMDGGHTFSCYAINQYGIASAVCLLNILVKSEHPELSSAADIPSMSLQTGGYSGWMADSNTFYTPPASIRSSPDMPEYTNNWLSINTFASNIAFRYKVSGANWGGYGDFYFDIDGTNWLDVNGETGWLSTNFRPSAGNHTYLWKYQRGYAYTGESNCAWVDGVVMNFDETPPVVSNLNIVEGAVLTNSNVSVVSVVQSVSPLEAFYYSIDGQEYETNWLTNGSILKQQITNGLVLSDGSYTLSCFAVNRYGLKSAVSTRHFEICIPHPELSLAADTPSAILRLGGGGWVVDNSQFFSSPASIRTTFDENGNPLDCRISMTTNITNISFHYRVTGADWNNNGGLYFRKDSEQLFYKYGITGWETANFGLDGAMHTYEWQLAPGNPSAGSSNCAWLDGIVMNFDETPPVVSNLTVVEGAVLTNTNVLMVSRIQSVTPLEAFCYSIDGQEYQTNWLTNVSVFSAQITNAMLLSDGSHTLSCFAMSRYGVISSLNTKNFEVYMPNPELSLATDIPGAALRTVCGGWVVDSNQFLSSPASIRSMFDGNGNPIDCRISLTTNVTNISFHYRLTGADWNNNGGLYFRKDSEQLFYKYGITGWETANFGLDGAMHTYEWQLAPGNPSAGSSNCVWLDGVVMNFDETPPVVSNLSLIDGMISTNTTLTWVTRIQSPTPLAMLCFSIDGIQYYTNWLTNQEVTQADVTNQLDVADGTNYLTQYAVNGYGIAGTANSLALYVSNGNPKLASALDINGVPVRSGGAGSFGADSNIWVTAPASVVSSDIGDSQSNYLSFDFSGTNITFQRKISSEDGWDYLDFYLDGVQMMHESGEIGWEQKNFAISAGVHTASWVYIKDSIFSSGSDCAWIDGIVIN